MKEPKMNISKKHILMASALCLTALSIIICSRMLRTKDKAAYTIGIIQTASHPALDETRKGFVDALQERLGTKVECILYNAQGSIATAHMIAQRMHADTTIDGIYAIATPAVQAITSIEQQKPIFIAAITDPSALGITHHTKNVCGVTDMIDMEKEIEMMLQLVPTIKTVALLYSSAELNSLKQVELLKIELAKQQIQAIEVSVTQESDILPAISLASRKADAIIAPSDNIIASAMELVAALALQHKKPLLTCYNQAVKQGALAARGVDYYQSGQEAGEYAYQVLVQGKKPQDLGIAKPKGGSIYINQKTLKELGLTIPDNLSKEVIIIQ